MLKKLALALGCLGFLVATTPVFGCFGDKCGVADPTVIDVGYDLNIDVDVCVDAGNLFPFDFWSAHAVIYQSGDNNYAKIKQSDTSEIAGIIQKGDSNTAKIYQSGWYDYALILQTPESCGNYAKIVQSLDGATGIIVQTGTSNTAKIYQGSWGW